MTTATVTAPVASIQRELTRCRNSPYYFLTTYAITLDGDETDVTKKFKPFPKYRYIKDICDAFLKDKPLFIEKSRQMTVSWTVMGLYVWSCHFRDGFQGAIVSRKEDLVDDKTVNSLLGKANFIWDRLPDWIKKKHVYSKLHIRCPATQSEIVGESSNPYCLRGGNFSKALMDEAAFIPDNEDVGSSIGMACKTGMIVVSTPNYRERGGKKAPLGMFKRLHKTKAEDCGYQKLRLHWTSNPRYAKDAYKDPEGNVRSPWYDAMCEKLQLDWLIAQELNISFVDSVVGAVYPQFSRERHVSLDAAFDPDRPQNLTFWDFGIHDLTVILWAQRDHKQRIFIFDEYMRNNEEYDHFHDIYIQERQQLELQAQRIRTQRGEAPFWDSSRFYNVGDPSGGNQRESDGKNWMKRLAKLRPPIYFEKIKKLDVDVGVGAMIKLLQKDRIIIHPKCTQLIEAFESYRYRTTPEGDVISMTPHHDKHSHPMDAMRYGAVWCSKIGKKRRGIRTGIW